MKQAGVRPKDKSGKMSAVEALRFYREFKEIKKKAGIPPYDPKDTDAIRKGFYGEGYGVALKEVERYRKAHSPC